MLVVVVVFVVVVVVVVVVKLQGGTLKRQEGAAGATGSVCFHRHWPVLAVGD